MTARDPSLRPARLTVGVISAGRVGAVLGAALQRAGHHVVPVTAVSDVSLRRAETLLPAATIEPPDRVAELAELLILAVPDDQLQGLVRGLAATGTVRRGALIAHTSGAHGIDVLRPLTDSGASPLALHPVMTFTGTEVDLQRLDGASFGVTATEQLRPAAEALVIEMGGEPVWIPEHQRVLYHAGLAFGANNLVTLVTQAADLLTSAGVPAPQRMLGPLLGAAMDNALRRGDTAMTGPVARGDSGTVRRHVDALRAAAPQVLPAYLEMSKLTVQRAVAAGLLTADAADGVRQELSR